MVSLGIGIPTRALVSFSFELDMVVRIAGDPIVPHYTTYMEFSCRFDLCAAYLASISRLCKSQGHGHCARREIGLIYPRSTDFDPCRL